MALEDDIAALGRAPLVGLLGHDGLRLIAFAAESRRLRDGEVLFREGEKADGGFVVRSGTILLGPEGGPPLTEAGPGSLIGRIALFVPGTRPTHARARGPAEVMRISAALMRRVLAAYPEAAAAMHDALANDFTDLAAAAAGVGRRLDSLDRT